MLPRVIKSNDVREPFNEEKLRSGFLKAVEIAITHIRSQLRATGEREVPSKMIGTLVMDALKKLDRVAYIRFAEDIREFGEEIARLQN